MKNSGNLRINNELIPPDRELYYPNPIKPDMKPYGGESMYIWLKVIPKPKPRFTRRDKFILRKKGVLSKADINRQKLVKNYNIYKDSMKQQAFYLVNNFPSIIEKMIFYLPVPQSISKKKKNQMHLTPHQVTPDIDNLEKAVLDIFGKQDNHVFYIGCLAKFWINDEVGRILIEIKKKLLL